MGLRAVPRSLVATEGISVDFFSSGYLDISVPRVRLHTLWIQIWIPPESGGFPHSEIPGSGPVYRLPEAYRRLRRPSSPLAAKASTGCTFMLDHIIQRILQPPCHSSANGQPEVGTDAACSWTRRLGWILVTQFVAGATLRTPPGVQPEGRNRELARCTKTHLLCHPPLGRQLPALLLH